MVSEKVGEGGPCECVCVVFGEIASELRERGPGIVSRGGRLQNVHGTACIGNTLRMTTFGNVAKNSFANVHQPCATPQETA